MRSEPEPARRERAARIMRSLLLRNALYDRGEEPFSALNPVHAAVLEKCGLLAVTEATPRPDDLGEWLTSPVHPKRLAAPAGPLLFVRADATNISVLSPADLLAEPDPDIRLAALRYFQELPAGATARRTRGRLEEARAQIASESREQWLPAARGVFDLLRNDAYLTLSGFHQSYTQGYEAGVNEYLPRVLRPDAQLLSSVELDHWSPTEERAALAATVRRFADAPSLAGAASGYCRAYGHLPLTGALGLGEVVRAWAEAHPRTDPWSLLWAWADNQPSPLPRYHIVSALLANPSLVPAGSENILWAEIADVIGGPSEEPPQTRSGEAWSLRDHLATHFGNHLECLLPGLPSERLFGMAWWLTERLCELLPASPGLLRKVRETTVASELERSSFINQLTHPPVQPSGLRYLTRVVHRAWSASTLSELGRARWLLERAKPPAQDRLRVEDALLRGLYQGYPPPEAGPGEPVYAFELPLAPMAETWCELVGETEGARREEIQTGLAHARQLAAEDSLPEFVELLAGQRHEGHVRLAHALKQRVYTDLSAGPTLWSLLERDTRWTAILREADNDVLSLLFEALAELAAREGHPWRAAVPHMFAITAENASEPGRRQFLFGLTLLASLGAGTTSALDRLMHGRLRPEFSDFASRWHGQLKSVLGACTPWAASRIRAVLPSLVLDPLPGADAQ